MATRRLVPEWALKWAFLGCVLPDVPWIVRRVVQGLAPGVDPYDLVLYASAQASLAVTVVLCAAIALVAARPVLVFGILSLNSLSHLFLDALETKWANGVLLLAPFSWDLWNVGWVWPESPVVIACTVFGLGYALWHLRPRSRVVDSPLVASAARWFGALGLVAAYLLVPLVLRQGPAAADAHYVTTLAARSAREGRYVEFDRAEYIRRPDGDFLVTFARDTLRLRGSTPATPGVISVRGEFTALDTVRIRSVHGHAAWFRDAASYVGLLLVAVLWIRAVFSFAGRSRRPGRGGREA